MISSAKDLQSHSITVPNIRLTVNGCLAGDEVLVTGAYGGVRSAMLQLAKRRDAGVTALTSAAKADAVSDLGADRFVTRGEDLAGVLGTESVDLVVDNVAGDCFRPV